VLSECRVRAYSHKAVDKNTELAARVVGAIAAAERRRDFRTSGRDAAKRLA